MPTYHDIQTFGSLVPAAAVSRYVRAVRDTRDEEYADRLMTKETASRSMSGPSVVPSAAPSPSLILETSATSASENSPNRARGT